MANAQRGHHRSTTWSDIELVNTHHPTSNIPSNRLATTDSSASLDRDHEKTLGVSMSRRTLRQSKSMIPERIAYPLPDPNQFENTASMSSSSSSSAAAADPTNDILYPMQSFKRERETSKPSQPVVISPRDAPRGEKQPVPQQLASIHEGLKQPAPPEKASLVTEPGPETLPEEVPPSTGDSSSGRQEGKVVVVHDAEKKFTTAAVDFALKEIATHEGDVIVVVAFLEHIWSPMGMRLAADLHEFSGVNESILKQTVLRQKRIIETKLRDTNFLQHCESKKIQLDVKVLPGSNSRVLVAKEILDFQATCAIFDKDAMNNRKYYLENLSCHILRLRSDGHTVETISLFGQGAAVEKSGCTTSASSESSSDSGSMKSDSSNIWSKLKLFGSKRSSGSVMGSSRTSSNLGSPRPLVREDDEPVAEVVLDASFSFDSPKPNPAEAYAYAAAGLDRKFGSYTGSRNGESNNLPTALAA